MAPKLDKEPKTVKKTVRKAQPAARDEESNSYWPNLILDIRETKGWSQAQFAKAAGTNQETVSRWETGVATPSSEKKNIIEGLAKRSLPTVLKEIGSIIKASPFPIILTDKNHRVLACSKASGFRSGLTVMEQTPEDEVQFFEKFANSLKRRGFWKKGGQKFEYKFIVDGTARKAVVISIAINREVFAVVQQA